LCTDAPISVLDLVWTIIRAAGVDNLEPDVHGSSGQPAEQEFLSNKRAKAVLGWVPEYSVEDGIRETFGWYQARHQ
jgi:nucleoside-diphosphate-sugar epimerase